MKLDAKAIAGLTLSRGKGDVIYWDDELRGFGFRVRQCGDRLQRTWVTQYRTADGRTRRHTLGTVETLLHAEARTAARKLLASVVLGGDPQGEKRSKRAAATRTFRAVVGDYLEARERELRPVSLRIARLYLAGNYLKSLHPMAVATITQAEVAPAIRTIERKHSSNTAAAARRALSTFFGWAIAEGLMGRNPVNPVIGTRRPAEARPRDRVLSSDELVAVWRACGDDDYGHVLRLLILLGARASEVGGMRWDEFDLDAATWSLPADRSKNRRIHAIVLSSPALEIVRSVPQQIGRDCLFGPRSGGFHSWSGSKRELDQRLGGQVKPWRVHDVRRSVATHMGGDLGIAPHVIENLLGHFRKSVATTYNRSRYDREVTMALAAWGEHVMALVEGRKRKVVPLRGAP